MARFDGNTYCEPNVEGVGDGGCQLRIVAVSGDRSLAFRPSSITTMLEVEAGAGEDDYSLTVERSRVINRGTWEIVVQHRVTSADIYFGIYGHHLTVERVFVP